MAVTTCSALTECFSPSPWCSWHVNISWTVTGRVLSSSSNEDAHHRGLSGKCKGRINRRQGRRRQCSKARGLPPGCSSVTLQQRCGRSPQPCNPQCPVVASSVSKMNVRLKPISPSPCQNPSQLREVMGQLGYRQGNTSAILGSFIFMPLWWLLQSLSKLQTPPLPIPAKRPRASTTPVPVPQRQNHTSPSRSHSTSPMSQGIGGQPVCLLTPMPPGLQEDLAADVNSVFRRTLL